MALINRNNNLDVGYRLISFRLILWVFLLCSLFSIQIVQSAQYPAGDLAPRGAPDGALNVGDLVVLQRIIHNIITDPTDYERLVGDVAPLGSPDGILNIVDFLILQ